MTPPSARGRLAAAARAIERHEVPAVVASFLLFFCIMAGYFAIRPVRETVGTLMGAKRLADLWFWVWVASLAVIPLYGWLVARFRRGVFLPWTYASVSISLVAVGLAFRDGDPGVRLSQFFWIFISVLNLFIISVFWSFLLELFRSDQAKRLFGVIAAGGTAGALVGPLFTDFAVEAVGNSGILFLGATLFALAIACQRILLRLWNSHPPAADNSGDQERDRAIGGNPFAGVWLVAKSPYLLGIALFVVLLSTASTLLYFEQVRLVSETFSDAETRTRVFARMDWVVQSLTIVSQLFLTGLIASRGGLVLLLSVVPIAMIFGFGALAVWNTFPVLMVLIVARRWGEYAFVRPGREMLWSALDKETKYKAKNFVDVNVYRGSDALVAQVDKAIENIGFGPMTIAVLGVVTTAVWALNGRWLGRRYDAAAVEERADVT